MSIVKMPNPQRNPNTRPELQARADAVLDQVIKEFYENVPYGTHLMTADEPDPDYYKRHMIEIILRLRMKRTVDAMAIRYFTHHDAVQAQAWCQYADNEMLHDVQFFVKDLEKMGVSREQIYATEPLFSTKLLLGYYQWGMEYEGTPLALIASVYFMEYVTTRTQPKWLDNLEKSMGKDNVRGARGHVNLDLAEDHDDFVWNVLVSLVENEQDEQRLLDHLVNVGRLFAAYFTELYDLTIQGKDESGINRLGESLGQVQVA